MRKSSVFAAAMMVGALAGPALAQFSVLEEGQEGFAVPQAQVPAGPCGSSPISIARMSWPSATLLAEIHARILTAEFGCEVRLTPGDLAATASSMGSTGQPAVAPEMWVNRIATVWNGAMDAQMVRSAAPTYAQDRFEGWYMPAYMGAAPAAATLSTVLPTLQVGGVPIRLISCPLDWACSVINRNLVAAYGLEGLVDIVEPANRLEMDRLIAEAVNLREPFLFYYWEPNAVLAQLDFTALDMGDYDGEAMACLGKRDCTAPKPSAFPSDLVVTAVAERVFAELPAIAGYFQRTSMPLDEMNALLAQLTVNGATPEAVADRFVAERGEIWQSWVGSTMP